MKHGRKLANIVIKFLWFLFEKIYINTRRNQNQTLQILLKPCQSIIIDTEVLTSREFT